MNNDFDQYKNNTIIINETSNNNTVINFIEIKNNYDSNKINNLNNEKINNSQSNIDNNKFYSVNFTNKNTSTNSNNLNSPDENEMLTHIPDDGIINSISQTFSPNKTFSLINNQDNFYNTISNLNNKSYNQFLSNNNNFIHNKSCSNIKSSIDIESETLSANDPKKYAKINTYKTLNTTKAKNFSDNNSKISKFTLLDNFLYGKEFLNGDNSFKNDINNTNSINQINNIVNNKNEKINNYSIDDDNKKGISIDNGSRNSIVRRTTKKKMKHRGGPEKTKNNDNGSIDFLKDYGSYDDCTLNIPKDLKCGCTGNLNEGCFIF
jgi:hypothetical protein